MSERRSRSRSPDREMLEICWKPIKEDPTNFDAWTHLLQSVEQLDETKHAREAYDEFLKRYPYCYGYWKKYAEFEKRHKHLERAVEIYERGVSAISLSIDLWLSYLAFYKEFVKDSEVRDRRIRYLYERAISAAGLEFRSDKLWDDYIQWEIKNKNLQEAMALYDRVLRVPTLLYSSHFDSVQEFVNSNPPDRILAEMDYMEIYKNVEASIKELGQEVYVVEEIPADEREPSENSEAVNGEVPAKEAQYRKRYNDEALKQFRVAILEKRRKNHLTNEQEVSRRWQYEEAIKRPYFHVKPLERAQLKNWRAYLDMEVGLGIHERIGVLFERCLIACAMYEDIWIKYARYMEPIDVEQTREIYKRACMVHVQKKPNPHLAWSAFEEKQGDYEAAKSILVDFDKRSPGLILIQLRLIGIQRRHTQRSLRDSGEGVDYSAVSAKYEKLLRDPKIPTRVSSFYATKFARFHAKVRNDRRLAEKILKDALSRDTTNPQLYLQLLDLAFSSDSTEESEILDAFDCALRSELSDFEKLRFSQRKLEFLEDFGTDVGLLQEHFEYHLKLYKSLGIPSAKRKSTHQQDGPSEDKRFRADGQIAGQTATPIQPEMAAVPAHYGPPAQPQGQFYQGQGGYYYPNQQGPQPNYNYGNYNQYGSSYYPPPQQY